MQPSRPLSCALALSSLLTIPGCSVVSDAVMGEPQAIADARPTPPPRKASRTSTPSTGWLAPERPASGSGKPLQGQTEPGCIPATPQARAALEAPTALPPAKVMIDADKTKAWIGALEDQVGALRFHLRDAVTALDSCAPRAPVAGVSPPTR